MEILQRTAADLFARGQLDEATVVYDKAAAAASADGDQAGAFSAAYRAATVQQERQMHVDAAERFLSLAATGEPRAAQAHLAAIVNTAQAVRGGQLPLSRYRELLDEHLADWPVDPSVAIVGMWRGQFAEQRHEWQIATASYRAAVQQEQQEPTDNYPSLVGLLANAWMRLIETDDSAGDAIAFFDRLVFDSQGTFYEWTPAVEAAALAAAQLRVFFLPEDAARAERLLQAVREQRHGADNDFRLELLYAMALGLQPHRHEAADVQLRKIDPKDEQGATLALEALRALSAQIKSGAQTTRPAAAHTSRVLAERLLSLRARLTVEQLRDVQLHRAHAVAAVDKAAALDLLKALATEHADDLPVQLAYGRLLLSSDDPKRLEQALGQWRQLSPRMTPRTNAWYEAKYSISRALLRLKRPHEAMRRIRYLQVTEDLAASGFGEQFEQLLRESERSVGREE